MDSDAEKEIITSDSAPAPEEKDAYDPWDNALKRARETAQSGRSPVITENSPGAVYARAIRNARKLGFSL